MKFYGGIGARKTPNDILQHMTDLAHFMNQQGWILRSGGATGADSAFAKGSNDNNEIFSPSHWTMEAAKIAADHHPAWKRLSPYVQLLMTRNVFIVLGHTLMDHSNFIICWTPDGKITGGTGHSLRVAETFKVPVINFGNESLEQIEQKIEGFIS